LSLFNKIDLNCYVFLPLSNDKLLLIIILFFGCSECREFQISKLFWGVCSTHVAFSHCYPSLISNFLSFFYFKYKYIVSINFGVNLNAQNAGNGISVLQISNIFWGSMPPDPPPSFMRGMSATWPSPIAIPLQYIISQNGPFPQNPPPRGNP
jgi:hypothetical protein